MDHGAAGHSAKLSTGAIVGIVVGILAFIVIKSVIIWWACRRKRTPISQQPSHARRRNSKEEAEIFLRQLKEHEFACHDIKICVDHNGEELVLGFGGFGRVLLGARNEHQPVAIKEMLNTDRKAKADFLKEIKLLKHVSLDANIVQYLGACFQEDRLWLVTEYMEGGDLRKALGSSLEGERLTWWAGGKQVALDVARGLIFLHSRRVIHGNLKSHNVLLTSEGKAKIADVGMAQIMSEDAASIAQQAKTGTLAWAAPELLVKELRCTEKVDIFSFGACLWEIVTSQIPQRGEMFVPSADDCPPAINSLIQDCMKELPEDRPSAKEVYRRLVATEPHHPEFGGLLDSAEGGGRRSQVIPRGRHLGQYPPAQRVSGIRRSLQAFVSNPPSTQEEGAGQDHVAIELTEQPQKGADSQELEIVVHKPGNVDEKVEFASSSPRYYRPNSSQPAVSTQSNSHRESTSSKSAKTSIDQRSLPSSNIAFSELVAKFTQANPELNRQEVRSELQDTAILSTVDADLSHIPSLHNTMTGDPLNREEASSLDSNDNEAFDAWLDPPQDMCMAPDTENARPVSSPDKPGPVQSSRQSHGGRSESSSEDGIESAAVESVQGYAGSESSSRSKVAYETAASHVDLGLHSPASSSGEVPEYEADLTSHHLEVGHTNMLSSSSGIFESCQSLQDVNARAASTEFPDDEGTSMPIERLSDPIYQLQLPSLALQVGRGWWPASTHSSEWGDSSSLHSADSFRVQSLE